MAAIIRGRSRTRADGQKSNFLLWSDEFDNAVWLKEAGGIGVTPVVTADAGTAPDGTETADRVQLDLGGGTTSDDFSQIRQSVGGAANPHGEISSVWVKSFDGGSYDVGIGRSLLVAQATIFTVTGAWQRISRAALAAASESYMVSIGLRGGQGTGDTADLLVWRAQTTPGAYLRRSVKTTDRAR